MKSKIFCAMVALAMIFSACNKDLPGQLADEGDLGVKKWYYNGEIPAYATSKIDASEFGNYKGDGKFNNGVNVKVIDGVYLSRVVSETNWVADNGNGKVFITFEEPKEGAWDCTGPLYMVVKYKASLNVSVEFDLKACVGLGTIPLDFPEWGPVTQIRYGEKPNEKCCKTTFELRFHRTDMDCYMNRNVGTHSIYIPAGDLLDEYLYQIGFEVDGGWVTDIANRSVDYDAMNDYFNLLPCQIAGGIPDGYPDHGWFVMYDNGDTAYPYAGSKIIGCPDVIHVFPVWKDCQPDPVYRTVRFFKNGTIARTDANADAVFKVLDGAELDVSYFYEAGVKPGYWIPNAAGGYDLDMAKLLAHFNTCAEVLPSQKWTTDADGVFPSQAPYGTVNKDLDLFNSYDPCPVKTFTVTFPERGSANNVDVQTIPEGGRINWGRLPNPETKPADWNAAGYIFDGWWYEKVDGEWVKWLKAHSGDPVITRDMIVAPSWIAFTFAASDIDKQYTDIGDWQETSGGCIKGESFAANIKLSKNLLGNLEVERLRLIQKIEIKILKSDDTQIVTWTSVAAAPGQMLPVIAGMLPYWTPGDSYELSAFFGKCNGLGSEYTISPDWDTVLDTFNSEATGRFIKFGPYFYLEDKISYKFVDI